MIKKTLTIISLSLLGLCLFVGLAKNAKNASQKHKKWCDIICGLSIFSAVVLIAVVQLLGEEKKSNFKLQGSIPNHFNVDEGGSNVKVPIKPTQTMKDALTAIGNQWVVCTDGKIYSGTMGFNADLKWNDPSFDNMRDLAFCGWHKCNKKSSTICPF